MTSYRLKLAIAFFALLALAVLAPGQSRAGSRLEPIAVFGEVKKPGQLRFGLGMKLSDALRAAGGFAPEADASRIALRRVGSGIEVLDARAALGGNKRADISLQPGDTLFVPQQTVRSVREGTETESQDADPYLRLAVVGEVAKPGPFIYEPVMMRDALRAAGGLSKDADEKRIVVRRAYLLDPTGSKSFTCDLDAISKGKAADVLLQPGDVIEVPKKGRKTFLGTIGGSITRTVRVIGTVAKPLIAVSTSL